MLYELITDEDYDKLPDSPEQQFVQIERICRVNMNEILGDMPSDNLAYNVRQQYMTTVSSAAAELGIPGVEYPSDTDQNLEWRVEQFMLAASAAVTRLKIRGRKGGRSTTVQLTARTRGLIELRIGKLREAIESGEMPPEKRKALFAKLDELAAEISSPTRVSFAKIMAALVIIAAGTSGIADAPMAIANIAEWIGIDKEAEDAEQLRLNAPMKALPHFPDPAIQPERPRRPSVNAPAFDPNDDSEIPF